MKQIKLIVTDLDRTLLNNDELISDYSAEVFRECRESGIFLSFATARPIRATEQYWSRIPFDYKIYHNGAVIQYPDRIKNIGIPHEEVKTLIGRMLESHEDIQIAYEANDCLYTNFEAVDMWKDEEYQKMDLDKAEFTHADKILFRLNEKIDVNALELSDYYFAVTNDGLCMIMNKAVSKEKALEEICRDLDLSFEEVAAFGDDANDLGMIRRSGVGVAVANALPEVKGVADAVCGANYEDGIARWIKENILQ